MKTLELIFITLLIILFVMLFSNLMITPRYSLQNKYLILKLEAYSVANVILHSNIFAYTNDTVKLKTFIQSLIPPNKEYMLKIIDVETKQTIVVKSNNYNKVTLSATVVLLYSDSINNKIYIIEFSLGEIR